MCVTINFLVVTSTIDVTTTSRYCQVVNIIVAAAIAHCGGHRHLRSDHAIYDTNLIRTSYYNHY